MAQGNARGNAGTAVLARAAEAMFRDEGYRANARRLQVVFARTDGPVAAAEAIVDLAGV